MLHRKERLNHLIRETISEVLRREIKDPRLSGLVSITEVSVSSDLSHAKIYFSVMGTDAEKKNVKEGMIAASGFFRRELIPKLKMRRVPELVFCPDESMERGAHLLKLIKQVSGETTEADKDERES